MQTYVYHFQNISKEKRSNMPLNKDSNS